MSAFFCALYISTSKRGCCRCYLYCCSGSLAHGRKFWTTTRTCSERSDGRATCRFCSRSSPSARLSAFRPTLTRCAHTNNRCHCCAFAVQPLRSVVSLSAAFCHRVCSIRFSTVVLNLDLDLDLDLGSLCREARTTSNRFVRRCR